MTRAVRTSYIPRELVVLVVALAVGVAGDAMMYAVLPVHAPAFGVAVSLVGITLSTSRYIRLVTNAWAASILHRVGPDVPFRVAMLVAAVTTLAYSVVSGFWALFVVRIVWGLTFSFLRIGSYLIVMRAAPEQIRGRLMGFLSIGSRLGFLVGASLGGFLVDATGLSGAFATVAAISALGFVLVMVSGGRTDVAGEPPAHPPSTPPGRASSLRLRRSDLLTINYLRFITAFGIDGLVVATLALIVNGVLGPDTRIGGFMSGTTVSGALLGAYSIIGIGSSTGLGHVSDKVGRRRLIGVAVPLTGAALAVIGVASDTWLASFPTIVVVLPVLFLADAATSVALDASAGELAPPDQVARVMGRYTTCRDFGAATAPVLAYALAPVVALHWIYLATALALVAGGLAYLRRAAPRATP
jgi:MFS family permease